MLKRINIIVLAPVALAAAIAAGCCSGHGHGPTAEMVEAVMAEAGGNAAELRAALNRYDDGRREAMRYAVAGMLGRVGRHGPGMDSIEALYRELTERTDWQFDTAQQERASRYAAMPLQSSKDVLCVTADYLAANVDDAWQMWHIRPWNRQLPPEVFYEMLLPYRIGDEPLTLWRGPYRELLSPLEDTIARCDGAVEAARIIAAALGRCPYNDRLSTPHRSALNLLEAPLGYCREECDRTVYAMRAMGVAVAVDMLPVSPDNGCSHMWTVVWDEKDRRTRMFDCERFLPTRDSLHRDQRRKGKVYRRTFMPDPERPKRFGGARGIPSVLTDPRLRDVTAEYFGHNRAEAEVWPAMVAAGGGHVMLGVFDGKDFRAVDAGETRGSVARFTDVEPRLIYAPITPEGKVCGYPFMLRADGTVRSFVPDEKRIERMRLTRKFPARFHLKERMATAVGTHIQSAPSASGPWSDLDVISTVPTHNYHRVGRDKRLTGPYIRIFKPDGPGPRVAMLLACRDTLGTDCVGMEPAGGADARKRYGALVRQEILSCTLLPDSADDCIVRLDSPDEVNAIFLVPHNDDNFVLPGQEYELLYFAGPQGWKSAGCKRADTFSVSFDAPAGAVLWLRNLTKGREEQIFVWHDGRQLFNVDLEDADI